MKSHLQRVADSLDRLPLGRTPLVMLTLLLISATLRATLTSDDDRQQLTYWAFARIHYEDYVVAMRRFEEAYPGWKVDLKLVDGISLVNRLTAAFVRGSGAPDACDIDINNVHRFFKGRPEDLPFEDVEALGARFGDAGWTDGFVTSRFSPWSHEGHIFGVPLALNPVVMLYRADLFAALGYPDLPAELKTWDDLVRIGHKVTSRDPADPRYVIGLNLDDIWEYWPMLLQRGGSFYDAEGRVVIHSPEAVATLRFYAGMFREHDIAWPIRDLPTLWAAIKRDEVMSFLAADWFVGFLRNNVPDQAGKWRAMALPAWYDGGRRTSTFGGSTAVIPKQGKQKEMAWELAKFLFVSPGESVLRSIRTRVMPVVHAAYDDPRLIDEEFAYLGGQKLGKLFADLRHDVPPVYYHSTWPETSLQLRDVLFRATQHGEDPDALLRQLHLDAEATVARYQAVEARLYGGETH